MLPINVALLSILITNKLISLDSIGDVYIDFKVIFFSIFLLVSSYSTAKLNSKKITTNKEFKYVLSNDEYLKLIGKGGDFYFFKSLNNSKTLIFKNNRIEGLSYYHFKENLNTKNDSIINLLIKK